MKDKFMKEALVEAQKAFDNDEVPIGCVIVKDNVIIARAFNTCEKNNNPLEHAEINAINIAIKSIGSKYLDDCQLYVTVEPCTMCAGAIINSRISCVVYGTYEPRTGAAGSNIDIFNIKNYKQPYVFAGVLEEECSKLMSDYFKRKR